MNFYDNFSPDVEIVCNIDRAERIHKELQNKICDLQYQDGLVVSDIASQLRNLHFHYVIFDEEMFHKIWYYATGRNKNSENKENENFDVDVCLNMLKEKIFDKRHIDNAKFLRICMYNYGESYQLEYEIYGQRVQFTFPMYERANEKNWYNMYYCAHYFESEHSLDIIASDLKRDVVFDKFNEWLDVKYKEDKFLPKEDFE